MKLHHFFKEILHYLPPELAHNLVILALKHHLVPKTSETKEYHSLYSSEPLMPFNNPIGLAAGFDKNAACIVNLYDFGFGFLELGTVTPKPQYGNSKPRIFRVKDDKAIINALGFNNLGLDNFINNLEKLTRQYNIGLNIGKNKDSNDFVTDYITGLERLYKYGTYFTINISSPNTPGLRDIQHKENLEVLLKSLAEKRIELSQGRILKPIFVKIAPDVSLQELGIIVEVAIKFGIEGLIISNTSIDKTLLKSRKYDGYSGGVSGKPIFDKSTKLLEAAYRIAEKQLKFIAVGGISNADDAYMKIKCGASFVQIYTSLIYQGFGLVEEIKYELNQRLSADSLAHISEAVGRKDW